MKYAVIWLGMWMLTWPALLADVNSIGSPSYQQESYRSNLGFSMLMALLPPAWLLAPFITGFYEHGMQFGRKPVGQER